MKHCVGIIAHKPKPQLRWLLEDLINNGFEPIVHADLKSRQKILQELQEYSTYVLEESIDVHRGHVSIVKASILLMEESLKYDYDYFHLISGEDFLVKSGESLDRMFENTKANYINVYTLPLETVSKENTRHFSDYSVFKDQIPLSNYHHFSLKKGLALATHYQFPRNKLIKQINKRFGQYRSYWRLYHFLTKRNVPDLDFYIGSAWFSVTKPLIEYFVEESQQNKSFLNYFKFVGYPDELYFQTLCMNSAYKSTVINSDIRYIDWSETVNDGPTLLNLKYWDEISKSNGIFSRKWDLKDKKEYEQLIEYRNAK